MNQFEMKQRAYQSNLKSRALQVLLYLIDRANREQTCFPAVPTIGRELHISVSTVKRAMRELVETGYVTKESRFRQGNRGQTSNLYTLYFPEDSIGWEKAEAAEQEGENLFEAAAAELKEEEWSETRTTEKKELESPRIVAEEQEDAKMTGTVAEERERAVLSERKTAEQKKKSLKPSGTELLGQTERQTVLKARGTTVIESEGVKDLPENGHRQGEGIRNIREERTFVRAEPYRAAGEVGTKKCFVGGDNGKGRKILQKYRKILARMFRWPGEGVRLIRP